MRKTIIAANWKMNGSMELVRDLVGGLRSRLASLDNGAEIVIMPPAPYIGAVVEAVAGTGMVVGAQNVARWSAGAYTGEVSVAMAEDVGCDYALVGHSERRELFGEDDQVVAEKVAQVLGSGLSLMLCVGESLGQRESGQAEQVVRAQVEAALTGIDADRSDRIVIAYEPVWAIGTGRTATAEDAQAMHKAIRDKLAAMNFSANAMSLLYGGSVKPDNAAALFAQPDIDGGLIGGASLVAEDFSSICQAV
ncbi:triose-phosphate isomerase [uncultured Marinobacter sp.]|uniref:triose-phosphate isomerase n=1 Tax=uncultured Marinobacter sp. TaxID=187379 RepID=UPI0030D82E7D